MASASWLADSNSTTAAPRTSLLGLPQELQDEILKLAYAEEGPLKPITRQNWDQNELVEQIGDRSYQPRSFPDLKIAEFLVSKHFFRSATRAWMSARHIVALDAQVATGAKQGSLGDVLCKHARQVEFDGIGLSPSSGDDFLDFPSMTIATFHMRISNIRDLVPTLAWKTVLEDAAIEKTLIFEQITTLRGMKAISIVSKESYLWRTDSVEAATWSTNLKRLQELAWAHVKQPKVLLEPDIKHAESQNSSIFGAPGIFKGMGRFLESQAPADGQQSLLSNVPSQEVSNLHESRRFAIDTTSIEEMPDSAEEIRQLMKTDPESIISGVLNMKQQLRALHARLGVVPSTGLTEAQATDDSSLLTELSDLTRQFAGWTLS